MTPQGTGSPEIQELTTPLLASVPGSLLWELAAQGPVWPISPSGRGALLMGPRLWLHRATEVPYLGPAERVWMNPETPPCWKNKAGPGRTASQRGAFPQPRQLSGRDRGERIPVGRGRCFPIVPQAQRSRAFHRGPLLSGQVGSCLQLVTHSLSSTLLAAREVGRGRQAEPFSQGARGGTQPSEELLGNGRAGAQGRVSAGAIPASPQAVQPQGPRLPGTGKGGSLAQNLPPPQRPPLPLSCLPRSSASRFLLALG